MASAGVSSPPALALAASRCGAPPIQSDLDAGLVAQMRLGAELVLIENVSAVDARGRCHVSASAAATPSSVPHALTGRAGIGHGRFDTVCHDAADARDTKI